MVLRNLHQSQGRVLVVVPWLDQQDFLVRHALLALTKECFHRAHWKKQPTRNAGKVNESVFFVKLLRRSILRINNNTRRSRLFARLQTAVERIHEQSLAKPPTPKRGAYRKPPEKRRRNRGILRKPLSNLSGNLTQIQCVLGKRVKARNCLMVRRNHKRNSSPFLQVLARLFLQIGV